LDIYVRDRLAGTTERVSIDSAGLEANGASAHPVLSSDGRYVAFSSQATNLVAGDTNGHMDIFVRDRVAGTTERVSVNSAGLEGSDDSAEPSISADGRYVAYWSAASNLVPADSNGVPDVFVRDRQAGTTERVSIGSDGTEGDFPSNYPAISADGNFVTFESNATFLHGGPFIVGQIYVRNRPAHTTERVSNDPNGIAGDDESLSPFLSADGRYVAFVSHATNLVSGDTNGVQDIFVHDRAAAGFTSSCDPGVGGVAVCPCSNPPSGLGRGCDNSSSTGGASLSASGAAYLSMDTLVFTTSGEKPTAASILLEGNNVQPLGIPFGQGVRCVGGLLKHLYVQSAVGGSVTMPNFGAGDPAVSTRAAQLGDIIQAGQSRWFLVYYRDPMVLGGCSSLATFNATQTGQILWSL
jgi:hypothetical protein